MKYECSTKIGEKDIKLNLLYDPNKLTLYILKNYGENEEIETSISLGFQKTELKETYVYNVNKNQRSIIQYYKRNLQGATTIPKALKWQGIRKIISESSVYETDSNGYLYNTKTFELLLCPYNEDKIFTVQTIPFRDSACCFDKAEEVICTNIENIEISPKNIPDYILTTYPNCKILRVPNITVFPFYCWKSCFPNLKKLIFNGRLKTDNDKILEDAKTAGFDITSDLEIIKEVYIDKTGKPIKNEE